MGTASKYRAHPGCSKRGASVAARIDPHDQAILRSPRAYNRKTRRGAACRIRNNCRWFLKCVKDPEQFPEHWALLRPFLYLLN